ncbi:MAG: hypothetical protein ACYC60_20865, partial [Thermoanaerobaculia bacterium]
MDHELNRRWLDWRNVGLVLPNHVLEFHPSTARTPKRTRNIDCLIDSIRFWPMGSSAVLTAGLSARLLRIRLRVVSRKRAGLPLACPSCLVERLAQGRVLLPQPRILRTEFRVFSAKPRVFLAELLQATPNLPKLAAQRLDLPHPSTHHSISPRNRHAVKLDVVNRYPLGFARNTVLVLAAPSNRTAAITDSCKTNVTHRSKKERTRGEERSDERLSPLHGSTCSAAGARQFGGFARCIVRERIALEVRPRVLDRIEFGSVGRQQLEIDRVRP